MRSSLLLVTALVSLATTAACSVKGLDASDDLVVQDDKPTTTKKPSTGKSMPAPVIGVDAPRGTMTIQTDEGTSVVSYREIDGRRIAFNDIALPPPSDMPGIASAVSQIKKWTGGKVPYVVTSADSGMVQGAIDEWQSKTGFRFVQRSNQKDYIEFFRGDGCYSYVGRIGGRQQVSLGQDCDLAAAVHEIGHAVGLWHEQDRSDRDNYLQLFFENMEPGARKEFEKTSFKSIGAFDYDSVMLYASYFFSANGQPTMLRKDGGVIEDRGELSAGDIAGLSVLYAKENLPAPLGGNGGGNGGGGADEDPDEGGGTPNPGTGGNQGGETTATTTSNLNLRSTPSTSASIVLTMPQGSTVTLTGASQNGFYAVRYQGSAGWAHADYLAE
jgi:hypothetical protein